MKVVLIHGSPRRKKSATYKITERIIAGMKSKDAEVEEFFLADKKINHCVGCYTCWTKTPGKCIHDDDMDGILESMRGADFVIHASPLYYYDVTGLFKNFTDRQLPLIQPYLVDNGETTGHPIRGNKPHPKVFLVSVCGFPERSHFDALLARYQKSYGETVAGVFAGHFLVPGAEPLARGGDDMFKSVLELAETTGKELVQFGKISDETSKKLMEETKHSREEIKAFQDGANKYWESQQPKDIDQSNMSIVIPDDAKQVTVSSGGTDTFFAGMAQMYRSTNKHTSKGIIQFNLDDDSWFIAMDGKAAKAYKGKHPSPNSTVIAPLDVWMDVSSGKKNGESEFMKGSYRVEGDMAYLTDMGEVFVTDDGNPEDTHDNAGEISSKRGPINLSGMTWMFVAFIPWIVIWVFGSIFPGLVPRFIATGISLLILIYHGLTNKPTLFELGTAVYLVLISAGLALNLGFIHTYLLVIDYIFLGGLWLGSSMNTNSLTAEYSGQGFTGAVLGSKAFKATNIILSCSWGLFFLVEALSVIVEIHHPMTSLVLMIIRYMLLVPMFIFTSWFQKWYPEKLLSRK